MRYCILILAFLLASSPAFADDQLHEQVKMRGQILALQEIQTLLILLLARNNPAGIDPLRELLTRYKHDLLKKNAKALSIEAGFGDALKAGLTAPFETIDGALLFMKAAPSP